MEEAYQVGLIGVHFRQFICNFLRVFRNLSGMRPHLGDSPLAAITGRPRLRYCLHTCIDAKSRDAILDAKGPVVGVGILAPCQAQYLQGSPEIVKNELGNFTKIDGRFLNRKVEEQEGFLHDGYRWIGSSADLCWLQDHNLLEASWALRMFTVGHWATPCNIHRQVSRICLPPRTDSIFQEKRFFCCFKP